MDCALIFLKCGDLGVYRLPQNTIVARKIKETMEQDNRHHLNNACQLCPFSNDVSKLSNET